MTPEAKKKRAACNAWALLFRKDARSTRRCKHWLRQYGFGVSISDGRVQVPFELACIATDTNPNLWGTLPSQG